VDSVSQKPALYVTLFEPQLVRSYLLSDKGDFFEILSNHFGIIIITSSTLKQLIETAITKFNLDSVISVIVFEKFQENFFTKVLSSIFRFGNKSSSTIQLIQLRRSLGDNMPRTWLRYVIYFSLANSKSLKSILRLLFYFSVRRKTLEKLFDQEISLGKGSKLFITSLTPLRGEDVPIGLFFRKSNVPIVASVRSWDNLVVNGMLPFLPDTFLCHSQYMYESAVTKQGIKAKSIVMSVTPSYQSTFIPNFGRVKDDRLNFSYMCQGLIMNPDDENFVKWLVHAWEKMPSNFDLYIVQHPAFMMHDLQIKLLPNVKLIVFQFDETSLSDYYSHLSKMDLVFGGGTTGLLDAAFLNIPVVAVGFEIQPQNYWESALRYLDYFPHSADFFKDTNIVIAINKDDLVNTILNHNKISILDREVVMKYTGKPTTKIAKVISNALSKY
jgi:hypothetical protein